MGGMRVQAQECRLVDITETGLAFVVNDVNAYVYVGVQYRIDLSSTDDFPISAQTWHSTPGYWNQHTQTGTTFVYLAQINWPSAAFGDNGRVRYFRTVLSTNAIPYTTTAMEVTVVNLSVQTVTEVNLTLEHAQGLLSIASLAPGATSTPYVFQADDGPRTNMSVDFGMLSGSFKRGDQTVGVYVFQGPQRAILRINNEAYELVRR